MSSFQGNLIYFTISISIIMNNIIRMIKDKDFGSRDDKDNWKPFEKIIPMPRYIIPFKPIKLIKWVFG